jgi:predicted nucleic acid-binding protein
MSVLVDSSVWISYFRGSEDLEVFDRLIEENRVVTNDLILAELLPHLEVQRKRKLINLLRQTRQFPMKIDWNHVVQMQVTCIRNGINKVGIPDLIIAQHALQNQLALYTLDKHFQRMGEHIPLYLY